MPQLDLRIESRIILDKFLEMAVKQFVSYKELSEMISADVQEDGYHFLRMAREKARKEHGVVFMVLKNKGLVRADDSGIIVETQKIRHQVRKKARKGLEQIHAIKSPETLTPHERVNMCGMQAIFAATHNLMRSKVLKTIEAHVEQAELKISATETLRLASKVG
jgi:hypothetical protein